MAQIGISYATSRLWQRPWKWCVSETERYRSTLPLTNADSRKRINAISKKKYKMGLMEHPEQVQCSPSPLAPRRYATLLR